MNGLVGTGRPYRSAYPSLLRARVPSHEQRHLTTTECLLDWRYIMPTHSSARDRHGRLRARLTARDLAVLSSLYRLRLLTSGRSSDCISRTVHQRPAPGGPAPCCNG